MTTRRFVPAILAVMLVLGACGSSDESSTNAESDAAEPAADAPESNAEASNAEGDAGAATLTIADGTVYEFEMASCDTSNNSDNFVVDPGYDLFGRSDDGFRLSLIRAIPDGGALGTLEGGFDENGVNPKISYVFRERDSVITLDGDTVTGDLELDGFISAEKIHGDDTTASLTVTC